MINLCLRFLGMFSFFGWVCANLGLWRYSLNGGHGASGDGVSLGEAGLQVVSGVEAYLSCLVHGESRGDAGPC